MSTFAYIMVTVIVVAYIVIEIVLYEKKKQKRERGVEEETFKGFSFSQLSWPPRETVFSHIHGTTFGKESLKDLFRDDYGIVRKWFISPCLCSDRPFMVHYKSSSISFLMGFEIKKEEFVFYTRNQMSKETANVFEEALLKAGFVDAVILSAKAMDEGYEQSQEEERTRIRKEFGTV